MLISLGLPGASKSNPKPPSTSTSTVGKSAVKNSEESKTPLDLSMPKKSRKRVNSEVSTDTTSGKVQVPLPETADPPKDQSERKRKVRKTVKGNEHDNKEVIHQAGSFALFRPRFHFRPFPSFFLSFLPFSGVLFFP